MFVAHPDHLTMSNLKFLRKVLLAMDKSKPIPITSAFKQHIVKQHKSDHGIIVHAESVSVQPVCVTRINSDMREITDSC